MRTTLLLALALHGCGKDDPAPKKKGAGDTATPSTTTSATPWQDLVSFNERTGEDGILEVSFEVLPGQTAFQISGTSRGNFVGLERVLGPDGEVVLTWEDWWTSDLALTDAFFGWSPTVAFNWPVRSQDPALTPGTWTVELYTTNASGTYIDAKIDGTVFLKSDSDLTAGEVPVHIVWAENQDKPRIVEAVTAAVERWRGIWATRGLTLVETYHTSTIQKDLSFAYDTAGSPAVADLVATLPPGQLVLVIGETVDGDADTYGLAAGIPGTLEATDLTWVLVGWLTHAGVDADFDVEEQTIMGETMAHEIGHYSGLYHPIDYRANYTVSSWDALADTPDCANDGECDPVLGDNLMYPYPVCDFNECVPAGTISADQAGVWHRYLGVK